MFRFTSMLNSSSYIHENSHRYSYLNGHQCPHFFFGFGFRQFANVTLCARLQANQFVFTEQDKNLVGASGLGGFMKHGSWLHQKYTVGPNLKHAKKEGNNRGKDKESGSNRDFTKKKWWYSGDLTSRRNPGMMIRNMVIVYYGKEKLLDYGPNGRTSGYPLVN